jgi:hypothetical protein
MDILTLIMNMMRDGTLMRLAQNPLAQFGRPARRYIGAELLPEVTVLENQYTEESIRYRTVVANAGTRYSPTQKKGGDLIGSFDVKLSNSDIAREFTGRDYDALLHILGRNAEMEAVAAITNWADTVLNLALAEVNEAYRWQALENALVQLRGDNGYSEDVALSNPAGHRVNVAGDWTDPTYDPFDDIYAGVDLLQSKGYTVSRIITSQAATTKLARNPKASNRAARITLVNGAIQSTSRASIAAINSVLAEDGIPPIERYDLRYRTQTGDVRFLSAGSMVFVAETGRDVTLDIPDAEQNAVIPNALGYTAMGRAAGQATPGRVMRAEFKENKPPRIEGEAWQTSFPVIQDPEAVFVLKNI